MSEKYTKYLEILLKNNIPLTGYINLKVIEYKKNSLTIKAPLTPNKNDKNIAFAGSIYSTAALAGWGFLTLKFLEEDINAKIVMSKGNILYKKPIKNDFTAECMIENMDDWEQLKNRVLQKSNGKIILRTIINEENFNGEPQAYLESEFYAWIEKENNLV